MNMPSINLIGRSLKGEWLKTLFKFRMLRPLYRVGDSDSQNHPRLIVSLTSYGRRVSATLPVTVCSLLRQTRKPDEIVVWLGQEAWNEQNLPETLKRLQKYGVKIRFCKDIRSYTKIVPSLREYPEDIIVTVDDDIYYSRSLLQQLYDAYLKNPTMIQSRIAHEIQYDSAGRLLPYRQWKLAAKRNVPGKMFATGVGGVLYPPGSLHSDAVDESKFLSLSPRADDIWLYIMEYLNKTRINLLTSPDSDYPMDAFYQKMHKEASLQTTNRMQDANDVQLRALLDYYGIKDSDLQNLA